MSRYRKIWWYWGVIAIAKASPMVLLSILILQNSLGYYWYWYWNCKAGKTIIVIDIDIASSGNPLLVLILSSSFHYRTALLGKLKKPGDLEHFLWPQILEYLMRDIIKSHPASGKKERRCKEILPWKPFQEYWPFRWMGSIFFAVNFLQQFIVHNILLSGMQSVTTFRCRVNQNTYTLREENPWTGVL